MTSNKFFTVLSVVSAAVAVAVILIIIAMPTMSNERIFESQNPMQSMMQKGSSGMMTMQVPKDVIISFESGYEVTTGKQTEVVLRVVDKQTEEPIEGAKVVIGIEKGLPMTTMDMIDGMFSASGKGNGTYAFPFTPPSTGYYTIHAHAIRLGKQMNSMMENHVDYLISAK